MSVSHTVSEIFSVKEWRDLETEVGVLQGHWKWRRLTDVLRYSSVVVNRQAIVGG